MNTDRSFIPAAEIDQRISEIEDLLRRLPIELQVLKGLKMRAVTSTNGAHNLSATDNVSPFERVKYKAKEAVLRYLLASGPSQIQQIVDQLEERIDSAADNRRRTLYSTISNLKRDELIREDGQGRVEITKLGVARLK